MKNEHMRYKEIGAKIKLARESDGLSQRELAEKVGFESATAISLIENGDRRIAIADLEKIADVLHKSMNFFLDYEDKSATDFKFALRSEKGLSSKDKDVLLSVYNALIDDDD